MGKEDAWEPWPHSGGQLWAAQAAPSRRQKRRQRQRRDVGLWAGGAPILHGCPAKASLVWPQLAGQGCNRLPAGSLGIPRGTPCGKGRGSSTGVTAGETPRTGAGRAGGAWGPGAFAVGACGGSGAAGAGDVRAGGGAGPSWETPTPGGERIGCSAGSSFGAGPCRYPRAAPLPRAGPRCPRRIPARCLRREGDTAAGTSPLPVPGAAAPSSSSSSSHLGSRARRGQTGGTRPGTRRAPPPRPPLPGGGGPTRPRPAAPAPRNRRRRRARSLRGSRYRRRRRTWLRRRAAAP